MHTAPSLYYMGSGDLSSGHVPGPTITLWSFCLDLSDAGMTGWLHHTVYMVPRIKPRAFRLLGKSSIVLQPQLPEEYLFTLSFSHLFLCFYFGIHTTYKFHPAYLFTYLFIIVSILATHVHSMVPMWRPKNLQESLLSFWCVGPGYGTRVIMLGSKWLSPLNHLSGSHLYLFSQLWRNIVGHGHFKNW